RAEAHLRGQAPHRGELLSRAQRAAGDARLDAAHELISARGLDPVLFHIRTLSVLAQTAKGEPRASSLAQPAPIRRTRPAGAAGRTLLALAEGAPACLTVSLIDGLVLARSAMHHSANYRSVMMLGKATHVDDPAAKRAALRAIVEHIVPGRWPDVRSPSENELKATAVLAMRIEEASAKVRTGPPVDDEEDYALPAWAGVIPLCTQAGAPEADPRLAAGIRAPAYARAYRRPLASSPRAQPAQSSRF